MTKSGISKLAIAAVGVILLVVALLVWMAFRIGDDPSLIGWAFAVVGFGGVVVWILWGIRRMQRIEDAEIRRFQERPGVDDVAFLHHLGVAESSREAAIAIGARQVFARLGCVPPEAIVASDRFYPDLEKLPFYDSIDEIGIILELEEELHVAIGNEEAQVILEKIPNSTVGDAVLAVTQIVARGLPQRSET